MKKYRSARELLAEIERALAANRPSFHHSPLDDVIELLSQGRHYAWVVYLAVEENQSQQLLGAGGDPHPIQAALPETRTKILVSIKLAGRELGLLSVEADHENAFGAEDRVLLTNVAALLARFLAGPGKYLVRKAREASAAAPAAQARGPRSASLRR